MAADRKFLTGRYICILRENLLNRLAVRLIIDGCQKICNRQVGRHEVYNRQVGNDRKFTVNRQKDS